MFHQVPSPTSLSIKRLMAYLQVIVNDLKICLLSLQNTKELQLLHYADF
jgi:hypothetical protein